MKKIVDIQDYYTLEQAEEIINQRKHHDWLVRTYHWKQIQTAKRRKRRDQIIKRVCCCIGIVLLILTIFDGDFLTLFLGMSLIFLTFVY